MLVPFIATLLYTWGGWLISANVTIADVAQFRFGDSSFLDDDGLPRASSIFVHQAHKFDMDLGTVLLVVMAISLISTSTATLYVASRALYSLASDWNPDANTPSASLRNACIWKFDHTESSYWSWLCISDGVPVVAVFVTAIPTMLFMVAHLADNDFDASCGFHKIP